MEAKENQSYSLSVYVLEWILVDDARVRPWACHENTQVISAGC